MAKKKPPINKRYSTNVDTISINVEQFCNADPLFPYKTEPHSEGSLYKKGYQFSLSEEPKPRKKRLRRHGKNINVVALSLNSREHSGPFLTAADETPSLSEINKLERAYRNNPSSLPPEFRHLMGGPMHRPGWKPTVYDEREFDRILWEGKADKRLGKGKKEVYAIKGSRIVNLVYDTNDNSCGFRRQMELPEEEISKIPDDLKRNSGIYDYLTLLSLFQSQEHYDIVRSMANPGYIPKVKVVVGAVPYHPKSGKSGY